MDSLLEVPKKRRRLFRLSEWRDWPGLPKDILLDIIGRLTVVEDLIRFGRVCLSWKSVLLQNMKGIRAPFLLITPPPTDENYYKRRALYSVSNTRVYSMGMQLPHNKICCGSSFGWLVTVEKKNDGDCNVELHNPILGHTFSLPHNIVRCGGTTINIGDMHFICKAVLCSDPMLSRNFAVMGIMGEFGGLAYFKPGNRSWTSIGRHWNLTGLPSILYSDVTFFRSVGQFYALRANGSVYAIEFPPETEEPKVTKVTPPLKYIHSKLYLFEELESYSRMYLAEDLSTGDLLQVHYDDLPTEDQNGRFQWTTQFLVFKFDPIESKWNKIHHLGDKVLFLGNKSSMLRTASDCPGCTPNCIYYTTDRNTMGIPQGWNKPPYVRIYNLGVSVQPDYTVEMSTGVLPSTIWLEPNSSWWNAKT